VSTPAAKDPAAPRPGGLAARLRRVTWSRVAFMAALIAVGLVLVNVLGRGSPSVTKAEALQISRPKVDFTPQDHQIRYIRRGIPPHGFWIVSYFIRRQTGGYRRVTVVVVDAETGTVTEVRKSV
jgi:hypothetical protein